MVAPFLLTEQATTEPYTRAGSFLRRLGPGASALSVYRTSVATRGLGQQLARPIVKLEPKLGPYAVDLDCLLRALANRVQDLANTGMRTCVPQFVRYR